MSMNEEDLRSGAMETSIASGPVEDVATPASAPEDPEAIDPNEKLWEPDGPTFAQVEEWKTQYGDVYVTSVTPERHIVWRTLNRIEYRNLVQRLEDELSGGISQAVANMNNEEAVAEVCILAPAYSRKDATNMAGVASIISQEVMEASAFVALEVRSL